MLVTEEQARKAQVRRQAWGGGGRGRGGRRGRGRGRGRGREGLAAAKLQKGEGHPNLDTKIRGDGEKDDLVVATSPGPLS